MARLNTIKVALVGNPNTGKTSLFNELTGLKQKVGNYPGVTVDKKSGIIKLHDHLYAEIIDLPGTYSINPNSMDENIVLETLLDPKNPDFPDLVIAIADIENMKRNLLLFSQIKDLELPSILAINMSDMMEKRGISIDVRKLKEQLKSEVILISAKKSLGMDDLKDQICRYKSINREPFAKLTDRIDPDFFKKIGEFFPTASLYNSWLRITHNHLPVKNLSQKERENLESFRNDPEKLKRYQHKETVLRYQKINEVLKETVVQDNSMATDIRSRLDKILTHKIFGYIIFACILFIVFQSVFDWASGPMDWIDVNFAKLSSWVSTHLPPGMLTDLLAEGIIPGIGGILIFIPQIVILFLFVSILEETGYMSRVVFLMDKIMRKYGMSGKSVVPLISGTACAIPAIMSARNIGGWKERLITILVTPFTTCSARLPVYAIIIALIIPPTRILGVFGLQGLTLFALYLLGFATALFSGYVLHKIIKVRGQSVFVAEMPNYKVPSLKNVFYTVVEKSKAFVFGAGKIILAISVVLWFLASNGPADFKNAAENVSREYTIDENSADYENKLASYKLEHSYIGVMGRAIEPAISPLGFDWKIGIAIISSFAAREVFVGTLATIYSVGDIEDTLTIKQKMANEINTDTGEKQFSFAVGMSLLFFYAFALQCISTIAIVKRETNSWKWPILQLTGMGILAYISSFLIYNLLS